MDRHGKSDDSIRTEGRCSQAWEGPATWTIVWTECCRRRAPHANLFAQVKHTSICLVEARSHRQLLHNKSLFPMHTSVFELTFFGRNPLGFESSGSSGSSVLRVGAAVSSPGEATVYVLPKFQFVILHLPSHSPLMFGTIRSGCSAE